MKFISGKFLYPLVVLLGLLFFIASVPRSLRAQASTSTLETPEKQPGAAQKAEKCEVCHNGTNPHTVTIPCNQVNSYLQSHPGDYAGPCQNVTAEKPPKPTPTPHSGVAP